MRLFDSRTSDRAGTESEDKHLQTIIPLKCCLGMYTHICIYNHQYTYYISYITLYRAAHLQCFLKFPDHSERVKNPKMHFYFVKNPRRSFQL